MPLLRKKSAPACKASTPRAPSPAPQLPPLPATTIHARRRSRSFSSGPPAPIRSSSLPLTSCSPAAESSAAAIAAQPWRSREAWLALHRPPAPEPSRTPSLEHPSHAQPGWRARGGGGFFGADATHDVVRRRLVDDFDAHSPSPAPSAPVTPSTPRPMPTSISAPALALLTVGTPSIGIICPTPVDADIVTPTSLLPPLLPDNVRSLSRRNSSTTLSRSTTPVPWSQSRGSGRTTPRSATPNSTPKQSSGVSFGSTPTSSDDVSPPSPTKTVPHPPSTADRYPGMRHPSFQAPVAESDRRASLPPTSESNPKPILRKLSAPVGSPRPAQRIVAPAPTHSPPSRPIRPLPDLPVDAVSDDEPEVDSVIQFEPQPPVCRLPRPPAHVHSACSADSAPSSPPTPGDRPGDAWLGVLARARSNASSAGSTIQTPDEKAYAHIDWRVSSGDKVRELADPFVCVPRTGTSQPGKKRPNVLMKKAGGRRVERGGWI
ncbi:hypothetical protein Q5752_003454 [Cryptotrichosporon argae]